ncbi:MAG: hypothetical protein J6B00_00275, partial [Alphaproteobacteria bacterium]|nr:hypothetical protein [Alphaproteobacteria bacterium]
YCMNTNTASVRIQAGQQMGCFAGENSKKFALEKLGKSADCEENVCKGFIFLKYKDGSILVFTTGWHFVVACRYYCFSETGFLVVSDNEIEQYPEYRLVKGRKISVFDETGKVVHTDLRGFAELKKKKHFIRLDDGLWRFCAADGSYKEKAVLKKANVVGKNKAMMFDERGKLRLGSTSIYYSLEYRM